MSLSYLERKIRRIRNSGWLFHEDESVADRAYKLLGELLDRKHREHPYHPPVDELGNTWEDRAWMARNGLAPADFM